MNIRKVIAIFTLVIIGMVLVLIISSPWIISNSQRRTYEAIKDIDLQCQTGTVQKIQGWSKAGFSISCYKGELNHGPWQAWKDGHIAVKGNFNNGKKDGTWLVFTNDGKLHSTIKYTKGVRISVVYIE